VGDDRDGALVQDVVDPQGAPFHSNCWIWAIWKFLTWGGDFGWYDSPRISVWRAYWAPFGDAGPKYHFEPTHPKKGLAGVWHSFWHLGRPIDLRKH
jgi:hypothetical protein